jgi:hypothetical protein
MTADADQLTSAIERIGEALALDITYLRPPMDRRFDPISAAEGVGSVLIMAYCNAFLDGMRQLATDLGERTAAAFAERVKAFFAQPRAVETAELADVATAARAEAQHDGRLSSEVDGIVEHALASYLKSRHLPDGTAREIAALVRQSAALDVRAEDD